MCTPVKTFCMYVSLCVFPVYNTSAIVNFVDFWAFVCRDACTGLWVSDRVVSHCSHIAVLSPRIDSLSPPLPSLFFAAAGACSVEPDLCQHHNRPRRSLSPSVTAHHITGSIWVYECINLNAKGGIMQSDWENAGGDGEAECESWMLLFVDLYICSYI